jgi:hypothetical protein
MARISESSWVERDSLMNAIERINGATYLEEVAQQAITLFYDLFNDSIVLARLFITVPYGKLPPKNRSFVDTLAETAKISHLITNTTPVLSLVGSRGEQSDWNDRRNSQGHVGIPMASGTFISSIPMMSRLLKQLGVDLNWIDEWDTKIVEGKELTRFSGLFYVEEAETALDRHGRKIIAAQDFVNTYNVQTVFGTGGGYLRADTFVVLIVFTREKLSQSQVEPFKTLINAFKIATIENGVEMKIFAT